MFKNIIESTIKKEVEIIKRFSGGMSNYTFLIKINDQLFTYRIPGESSEEFINREDEYNNINIIKKLNLNCDNIFFNTSNGHKMSKYLIGEDLSTIDINYNEVASKLLLLHNSNLLAVNDYDMIYRLNKYEKMSNSNNEKYFALKESCINFLHEYKDVKKVFCHNDAQRSNWVKSNDLYLLDWEFSGNNDPFYDIASFGNKCFNDAIILLGFYLKRKPNQTELKRLFVNRMFQCLQWYNVALYKENVGLSKKLNIDFKDISKKYLILAEDFLTNINEIIKKNKLSIIANNIHAC